MSASLSTESSTQAIYSAPHARHKNRRLTSDRRAGSRNSASLSAAQRRKGKSQGSRDRSNDELAVLIVMVSLYVYLYFLFRIHQKTTSTARTSHPLLHPPGRVRKTNPRETPRVVARGDAPCAPSQKKTKKFSGRLAQAALLTVVFRGGRRRTGRRGRRSRRRGRWSPT